MFEPNRNSHQEIASTRTLDCLEAHIIVAGGLGRYILPKRNDFERPNVELKTNKWKMQK